MTQEEYKDEAKGRNSSNSLSAHFDIGFTAPTKADTRTDPFYLKYSPDNVLKDGGVKFRSLSFGLYM